MSDRLEFAKSLAQKAGDLGLTYFRRLEELTISAKGHQDLVSEADQDVETLVRDELARAYPDDGILGEEHGRIHGTSGYTWVIDPIDGTANFVTAIPQWCVVLACVHQGQVVIGVTFDPVARELFWAERGAGAFVNGMPMKPSASQSLANGSLGVGFNGRSRKEDAVNAVQLLIDEGGVFFRNASGGLMLAYAASGRLIGYVEAHMNAWDCLAGMLMAEEAGVRVAPYDADAALDKGTRVVVASPGVFDAVVTLAEKAYA